LPPPLDGFFLHGFQGRHLLGGQFEAFVTPKNLLGREGPRGAGTHPWTPLCLRLCGRENQGGKNGAASIQVSHVNTPSFE